MEQGWLHDVELFFCTDNSTAEGAFYSGTSTSAVLHDLILRIKVAAQKGNIKLHVIHIAGTRMIDQETDAMLRGALMEGAMAGKSMLHFVPFNRGAAERSDLLLPWLQHWLPKDTETASPLEPRQWFLEGQGIHSWESNVDGIPCPVIRDPRAYVWAPPPAAADVALEQLILARHKRPHRLDVFVCPRLMTHLWRRRLYRMADVVFEVPVGHCLWPNTMHEPLFVGLFLPLILHRPWQLGRSPQVVAIEGELHRVLRTPGGDGVTLLQQFCSLAGRLGTMLPNVVRRVLQTHPRRPLPHPGTGR